MPLVKITPRPGLNREATNYSNEGQYWDSDKVRFRSSRPEKIGGWVRVTDTQYLGTCRSLWNWTNLNADNYLSIGTNNHLYIEAATTINDVTPLRTTTTPTNALTTNSTTTVTVADTAHGASTGDYVVISGLAAALNGIPITEINTEHYVTYVDADHYTITVTTAATSSGTPASGSITIKYLIASGLATAVGGTGWGAGTWGRGTWGSASSIGVTSQLRLWSQDNYGEDLFANIRDGAIYYWDNTTGVGTRAVNITTVATDVPTVASCIAVTDDRHLVAYGCNEIGSATQDRLLVRWATQEDFTIWTQLPTNTAGEYRLSYGSQIITAEQTKQETLIFTDSALYSQKFLGPPYTFGFDLVSSNTSIISPNSVVTVNNTTYWMGVDKFYVYNGRVDTLQCNVRGFVFQDFDHSQAYQVCSGSNEQFNEVWWFYCSNGMSAPDRYVIYNYLENLWYVGTMDRTAWLDSKIRVYPIAASDGYLLYHEVGFDDVSSGVAVAIEAYIETADMDIEDGERFSFIKRLIPDITFENSTDVAPAVNFTVKVRNTPGSNYSKTTASPITRSATVPVEQFTEQAWIRLRGRQVALRVESTGLGVAWQLGNPRIEIQPDGRRA